MLYCLSVIITFTHFRLVTKDTQSLNMSDMTLAFVVPHFSEKLNMEEERIVNEIT